MVNTRAASQWKERLLLYVISDGDSLKGRSHQKVVREALQGGATAIQLRDKTLSTRELLEVGKLMRELTYRHHALLIVNDRVDVAIAVEADGVHLGQEDMHIHDCRRLTGNKMIVGISARSVEKAQEAEENGADYLGSGPVFPTSTKEVSVASLGLKGLANICSQVSIPVVGIGGIAHSQAEQVIQAGASGVAVISAVVAAPDPRGACQEFRRVLDQYR